MFLFLCTTPLQVRIAQYLSKQHEKSSLVYITELAKFETLTDIAKEKQTYYAQQCDKWVKWYPNMSVDSIGLDLTELKGIYYASFDNWFISNIVKSFETISCFSFDDGLADVYTKSIYTLDSATYLKNRSLKHYTLYDSDNHVISKARLIKLDVNEDFGYRKRKGLSDNLKDKLNLLLGEEICVNPKLAINFNLPYLETLGVDVYLPHPSSRFQVNSSVVEVTPLILEDYLLLKLKEYREIEIYHFSSSASIHLQKVEGLTFKGIKIKPLQALQSEMEFMGASFNAIPIQYKL